MTNWTIIISDSFCSHKFEIEGSQDLSIQDIAEAVTDRVNQSRVTKYIEKLRKKSLKHKGLVE